MRIKVKQILACLLMSCLLGSELFSVTSYASGSAAAGNKPSVSGGGGGGSGDPSHTFAQGIRTVIVPFGELAHLTNAPDIEQAFDANAQPPNPTFVRVNGMRDKHFTADQSRTVKYFINRDIAGVNMYDGTRGWHYEAFNRVPIDISVAGEAQTLFHYVPASDILDSATAAMLAQKLYDQFGDANGKLSSLMNAMAAVRGSAGSGGGSGESSGGGDSDGDDSSGGSGGSYEVESLGYGDLGKKCMSASEVEESFKHYIDWWDATYTVLGGIPSDCTSMSEIRSAFEAATNAAKSSSGGPSSGGHNTVFRDWLYMTEDIEKYPYVVIEQITMCVSKAPGYPGGWIGLSWGDFRGAPWECPEFGFMSGSAKQDYPLRPNQPQSAVCSAGFIYEPKIVNDGDLDAVGPLWTANSNYAGFVYFGFYGALPMSGGTPTDDPEDPDDPAPPPPSSEDDLGTYYLMDYEMNHVFDSMAEYYQDSTSHDHARLNSGICTTDPSQYNDCGQSNKDYDTTEYYDVTYKESSASGPSVSMDDSGPTKVFLHNNGAKGGTWWLRSEIKSGQSIDSNSVGDYIIDYGFNLVRKNFNDARAYSKLIDQEVSKEYLENTLGMYEAIITNSPAAASAKRNSKATVGAASGIKDTMSFDAKYTQTNSTTKYETYSKTHRYHDGCGTTHNPCPGHDCDYNGSRSAGSIQAYSVHGSTPSTYSVGLISIAHKYQTQNVPTGYAVPKDDMPYDYRPTTNGDGSDDDHQYRGANTIDPSTEVKFVPEVPMLVDEVPGPELEHHPKKVTTMGEVTRKSKLILMTLYRITGASNPVKGVVYTDTAVGGDSGRKSQSGSKLALTAGGDFTVKADTNMKINLYGYALDLIEPGDAGYDTVTKGNDVKAGWSNSGSRQKLMETYQTWASTMLNPKNYQADFEMTIGSKKYNSFSATVGSFGAKASQSTETGQYNIAVKHGDIVHDAGYNAFIDQLADDYGCSTGEAAQLFEDSDMKQAIIKAIEHDRSSVNKSKPAKYEGDSGTWNEPDLASQIGGLGSSSHWYDEEVRVFVLRRFMTPAATINNIIAQDKMDIGTSMSSLGSDTLGKFNLNVWFRSSCYTRAVQEYYPSTGSDNKDSAIADGDLVVAGVYVNGADFNITNSTTATGRH